MNATDKTRSTAKTSTLRLLRRTASTAAVVAVVAAAIAVPVTAPEPTPGSAPMVIAIARADCPPDCGPGGGGTPSGPPGGGSEFVPPSMPAMPSYEPGRGQPPLDQNNGISIYNSAAPQPSQAAQPSQAPVQNQDGTYNRAANGEQQPIDHNAPNNQQLNNNWQKLSDQLNQQQPGQQRQQSGQDKTQVDQQQSQDNRQDKSRRCDAAFAESTRRVFAEQVGPVRLSDDELAAELRRADELTEQVFAEAGLTKAECQPSETRSDKNVTEAASRVCPPGVPAMNLAALPKSVPLSGEWVNTPPLAIAQGLDPIGTGKVSVRYSQGKIIWTLSVDGALQGVDGSDNAGQTPGPFTFTDYIIWYTPVPGGSPGQVNKKTWCVTVSGTTTNVADPPAGTSAKFSNKPDLNNINIDKSDVSWLNPSDLEEKLAMEQVKSKPQDGVVAMPGTMRDTRWFGWTKMRQVIELGSGRKIVIHYLFNPTTGMYDDFKFKF